MVKFFVNGKPMSTIIILSGLKIFSLENTNCDCVTGHNGIMCQRMNLRYRLNGNRQPLLNLLQAATIAAFIDFIFLLFRSQAQRQKLNEARLNKEKLEVSLQSIRSQLNPHFIFNALNSIQALINKNDTDVAKQISFRF